VKEFFELFFANEKFKFAFHQQRGDTEINFSEWKPSNEPNKFERTFKFFSPTSTNSMIKRLAGATVEVLDTEYYSFLSDSELYVETTTQVSGAMASSFGTWIKWTIKEISSHLCSVTLLIQNEYKGSWMKGTIEEFIHEQSKTAFKIYLEMARERVKEYVKEKAERESIHKQVRAPTPERMDTSKILMEETQPALPSPVRSPRKHEEPQYAPEANHVKRKITITSDSDDEDEYYDVDEWSPEETASTHSHQSHSRHSSPALNAIFKDVSQHLDRLKHVLELTQNRLHTLETSFINLQERMTLTVNQSNTIQVMNDTISNYYQRLELISKERLEQEQKAKEREETLVKRVEDLSNRISRFQVPLPSSTFARGVALGILLIIWPVVAGHAWKFVSQVVWTRVWKK